MASATNDTHPQRFTLVYTSEDDRWVVLDHRPDEPTDPAPLAIAACDTRADAALLLRRLSIIAGLRDLADWLEVTPDAPVPYSVTVGVHLVDRDEFLAGAAATNVTCPHNDHGPITRWSRSFGPTVEYAIQIRRDVLGEPEQVAPAAEMA